MIEDRLRSGHAGEDGAAARRADLRWSGLLGLALAVALSACTPSGDGVEERPASPEVAVTPDVVGDSTDTWGVDEVGIPDLARLSRYVYREMSLRADECGAAPLSLPVDYSIELSVSDGRIIAARLAEVWLQVGAARQPMPESRWPRELTREVDCLATHLGRLELTPRPADGVYPARFSAGPASSPRAPTSAGEATTPDPTEPGLPDMVRIARYVYRQMGAQSDRCSFENPFPDAMTYALETEVLGGVVVRSRVTQLMNARDGRIVAEHNWPLALVSFAECLAPHLEAMQMAPAPQDGVYRPQYTAPAAPDGP